MTALWVIVLCGALSIVYAIWATSSVLKSDAGNPRMQEIAAAVAEGAQAYLKRQYMTIGMVGVVIFALLAYFLGMLVAIGFLIGAIQLPIPGIGKLAIGLSGVLIVALVLGNLRRTGGLNWTIPLSANLVLRNLGLTLFLAQIGMSSGPKFAATVTESGLLMLGLGAVVLLALVLPILILGLLVYRMPYDEVAGIVAGACGNPAILAYANKVLPTERTDIGYAMIFPGMTIIKILFVDVVPAFFS